MFWHDKGQGYGASPCFGRIKVKVKVLHRVFGRIKVKVMVLHCVSAG